MEKDLLSSSSHKHLILASFLSLQPAARQKWRALCRYRNVITPVAAFINSLMEAKGVKNRGQDPADLNFADLEVIHQQEVASIRQWLTELIKGFSSEVMIQACNDFNQF